MISAPFSTKNKTAERDLKMRLTKNGHYWFLGMKADIGMAAESGLVGSLISVAANAVDVSRAIAQLHGQEAAACGDAGYQGSDRGADNRHRVEWKIAMRPSNRKALQTAKLGRLLSHLGATKVQLRPDA